MSIFTYAIGTNDKIYLSTDKGLSWIERAAAPYSRLREIYADPNYLTKVWVGGSDAVGGSPGTVSIDAALTFSNIPWEGSNSNFLQYQTIDSTTVYVAAFGTIAKSINGGNTFSPTVDIETLYPSSSYVWAIYFNTTDAGFAGIGSSFIPSKLFRTYDACATWTEVTTVPFTGNSNESILGISSTNDGRYVIITTTYGIYVSDEELNNWTYTAFPNTGRSNIYKLSETEYFVAFYSDGNTSSFFYTTSDTGLTWNAIPFTGTTPDLTFSNVVDVYMYNSLEGNISISGDELLYTSDGGTTFTASPLGRDVYAFTVTEHICDECPEGYTKDGEDCVKTISYPATYSLPELVELIQGDQVSSYGKNGLNLMQTISVGSLPLLGGGPGQLSNASFDIIGSNGSGTQSPREAGYSPLLFSSLSPIINSLWNNRLKNVGIWVSPDFVACNPNTSLTPCVPVSFSWCVNPTTTKTYLIGIAGDNEVQFKVDGFTYLRITGQSGSVTAPFNYWHVFPVELTAGQHTITLEGFNFNLPGQRSLGAEIYDITVADFKTLFCDAPNPSAAELEPYIIFSTKNTIGLSLPDTTQEGYPGEWLCAEGWEVSYCFGVPQCTYVQKIPFVKCYYELSSCLDPETVMYTATDLSAYIGMIIRLDDNTCWGVVGKADFYENPVDVIIQSSYSDCPQCLPSYQLVNCKDPDAIIYTSTDLSDYVQPSQVIKLNEYPGECWTAGTNNKAEFIPQDVTVDGEPFTTCIKCNPTIYQLNNCFNGSSFILSDSDLAAVMGKTISIVGYPGLCFSVGEPTCDCIKISGDLGGGAFSMDVQKTGISLNGRNQYAFTDDGTDYFINWDSTQSAWVLTNLTLSVEISISPIDIECPYSSYWRDLTNFVVESCSTVLYDIIIDTIYPNCECCITKSCN